MQEAKSFQKPNENLVQFTELWIKKKGVTELTVRKVGTNYQVI
jgi:hypothetical protein